MRNRFSRRSDDADVKGNRRAQGLDDRTVDALLSGRPVEDEPALSAFVAEVQGLRTTPAPNEALAAMLEHGVTPVTAPIAVPARRRDRRPVQVAAVIGAAFGLVVSAGAANALPGPVQNGVSDVVGWVSPLDLPRDDDGGERGPVPAPSPSRTAEPGDDHGSDGPEPGDDHGTRSPEPGDDRSGPAGSGSDDSGSGSDDSGSGSSDSGSGSDSSGSDSGSSDSSGSGSDDGSDDHSGSSTASPKPSPTPTRTSTPTPTPTSGDDHSSDGLVEE